MKRPSMDGRRQVLRAGVAGAGLLLGIRWGTAAAREPAVEALSPQADAGLDAQFNAFVAIMADGRIKLTLHKSEMGQGIHTALAMLIAEEMEVGLETVTVVNAPAHPAYYHAKWGPFQGTGASTSVSTSWLPLRRAGAAARHMLVAAAARLWQVPVEECHALSGAVYHAKSRRMARYGELAPQAAKEAVPIEPDLKQVSAFKLIGRDVRRVDALDKVSGRAIFGLDVSLPGMLVAVMARPPVPGAQVQAIDQQALSSIDPRADVRITPMGVAVLSTSFWAAQKALRALKITWSPDRLPALDSVLLKARYRELSQRPGTPAHGHAHLEGGGSQEAGAADRVLDLVYEAPYLAHAAMEPLNCVAHVQPGRCDVWCGTQMQTTDQQAAAALTGLPLEAVHIHTTLLGGSFGRRANPHADFVKEAVYLSHALQRPVQVVWRREDDMKGGFYRPMSLSRIEMTLDAAGAVRAWSHRVVSESIVTGTPFAAKLVKDGVDHLSIEGATPPYRMGTQALELHTVNNGVSVLWWRSVGHSVNAFAVESAMDEAAANLGRDPLAWRLSLLPPDGRHARVLALLAERAGWHQPLPPGRHRGLAIHESFGSVVGQVVELSVDAAGHPKLHRVVCAVDCGLVVHPQNVRRQIVSGVVYALSAALSGEIHFDQGQVRESNFHDYRVLRMGDMPQVDVHLLPSDSPPSGVGEVGVPPLAPALAAAYFRATGVRIRRLPLLAAIEEGAKT